MEWNPYPETEPPEDKNPVWYDVLLDDNSISNVCWWLGVWYCCSYWDRIIGWRKSKHAK